MAKRKNAVSSENPLAGIPSYVRSPEGVFEDIHHYRRVAERITAALAANRQRKNPKSQSGSSLYDGIQIEFSTHYTQEEIHLDAMASKIVLRAPMKSAESENSLQVRRMFYLQQLLRPVEAMKAIGIAQVYLSLKAEGRKEISKRTSQAARKAKP